ncbi:type III-B CRISPR system CMR subunit Cmr7 [Acidianus sp. HS-5]|uniref:type III-B CRISPR system CMR subunit Cmr7 n=1 Tax=Acidianus sp. HS-5 TaxID=2886040 RepID=UPI001F1B66D4|nr:type III-B CRISPR system CMR subunit Cmr7 [Acidianus sp. HS-5]BDC17374.1 hypothetical protein HS5_02640 [Acidianus sp. HS-5]
MATQNVEYFFLPLVKDAKYNYKDNKLLVEINNNTKIDITVPNNSNHFTKITNDNNGNLKMNDVLVLTGYALKKDDLSLVPTLDPCDYVKGILIYAQFDTQQNVKTFKFNNLDKLYLIRKSKCSNQQITVKIMIKDDPLLISTTKYEKFESDPKNICGISKIYGIDNYDKLLNLLNDIINYYYIA